MVEGHPNPCRKEPVISISASFDEMLHHSMRLTTPDTSRHNTSKNKMTLDTKPPTEGRDTGSYYLNQAKRSFLATETKPHYKKSNALWVINKNSSACNPRQHFRQLRTKEDMWEETNTRSMTLGAAENTKTEETNPNPNSNPKPKPTRFVSSDVICSIYIHLKSSVSRCGYF